MCTSGNHETLKERRSPQYGFTHCRVHGTVLLPRSQAFRITLLAGSHEKGQATPSSQDSEAAVPVNPPEAPKTVDCRCTFLSELNAKACEFNSIHLCCFMMATEKGCSPFRMMRLVLGSLSILFMQAFTCVAIIEQGASASHIAAAKIMDVIARMPGNYGEDSDAIGAYTQVTLAEAAKLLGSDVVTETWINLSPHPHHLPR